jgi:TonB family protein
MTHLPEKKTRPWTLPLLLVGSGFIAGGVAWLTHRQPAWDASIKPPTMEEAMAKAEATDVITGTKRSKKSARNLAQRESPKSAIAKSPREDSRSVDSHPVKVLEQVKPSYPAMARATRLQGPVEVRVRVNAQGQAENVEVLSGPTVFHQEALRAAKAWRFEPAMERGKATPSNYTIRFNFRLA